MEQAIILIVILIFSVVVHELMHGVVADKLGDPTARYAGRLTLNPLPHLDLWGSIIIPAFLALSPSPFIFGWAKPVPYNPYNLRADGLFARFSEALVAFAGPASNLAIALLFGTLIRLGVAGAAEPIMFLIVFVNILLFVFNLIPIPPLDGSKVLEALLPRTLLPAYQSWRARLEMNPFIGMGIVLLFIILFGSQFGSFVFNLAALIVGA
jgi:Zn-dependent protease